MPKTCPGGRPPGIWEQFLGRPAVVGGLLAACVLAVYWPVRGYDFIAYDDPEYITGNWRVQTGLTWDNVRWAFTTGYLGNWLPLTWLSHMLDTEMFGLGAGGPHLVNVALHAVNSVLVFLLLRRLTGAPGRSVVVAGLFALHPLRVESVAWVCERRDVLSAFFALVSQLCYARFAALTKDPAAGRKSRWMASPASYGLAVLFFAASLMSKPMLVTLPFALLLLDYWPLGRMAAPGWRGVGRLVLEKTPFFLIAALISLLTVRLQSAAGAVSSLERLPLTMRLENALIAYASYVGKLFWPTDLALPYLHTGRWPAGQVALAVLLVAGLTLLVAWLGRNRRYLVMGWFWFLGTLVPVIGIVQAGPQYMADRFVYLPALGMFVVATWGAAELLSRRVPKIVLPVAAVAVLAGLTLRTMDQLRHWRDSETLFRHTLAVMPDNPAALNGLGICHADAGRLEEAIESYQRALQGRPGDEQTLNNLGNALVAQSKYSEALAVFEKALAADPGSAETCMNYGSALAAAGRTDEAIEQLRRALQLRPDYPDAHNNLGNILALKGELEAAIAEYRQALRLKPGLEQARVNLGNALGMQGDWAAAAECYRELLRQAPADVEVRGRLGYALFRQGRPEEALVEFQTALRLSPESPGALLGCAQVLVKLGRRDEAQAALFKLIQLQPGHAGARRMLQDLGVQMN